MLKPTKASFRPTMVGLVDGTPYRAWPAAPRKSARPLPSEQHGQSESQRLVKVRKAGGQQQGAKRTIAACTRVAISSGREHVRSGDHRQNLDHRPEHHLQHEADGDQMRQRQRRGRPARGQQIRPTPQQEQPASMANSGAVRKKRNGAESAAPGRRTAGPALLRLMLGSGLPPCRPAGTSSARRNR
jgi:hypothetical protein